MRFLRNRSEREPSAPERSPVDAFVGEHCGSAGEAVAAQQLEPNAPADLYRIAKHADALDSCTLFAAHERWETIRHGGRASIFSMTLNRMLLDAPVPVELADGEFELPEVVKPLAGFVLGQREAQGQLVFNGPKLRLASDVTPESVSAGEAARLGRTDYFSSLVTNDLTLSEIHSREQGKLADGRDCSPHPTAACSSSP